MEPLIFDSHDEGAVEDFLSRMYSRMRIGASGERTHTRISRRVMTPEVAFDDLQYTFDVSYDAEPQRYLIVSNVISGTIYRVGEGVEETFGPGDLFLICRPDLPYAGVAKSARLRQLTLDPAVLSQVASGMDEAEPVRVLSHRPVSRQAALSLQRALGYVRTSVLAAPGLQSDLVVSAASQYLAARVLATFPNTAVTTPTAGDRRDANPDTMRRATSFIEANPDIDLTLTDIARASCVTPRALQLAFRRHLNTTPMAYLRRVRLDHARDDLRSATPGDGQTVTAIAYRWGFPSPSRFAEQYRAAYGEIPSQALRE
jgi:AraC-like DNA-binding protein